MVDLMLLELLSHLMQHIQIRLMKCFDCLISQTMGTREDQKKKLNDGENEETTNVQ